MAKMGKVDMNALKSFQRNLNKLANEDAVNEFCEDCAKELAARLLRKVIKRTPVGYYVKEIEVTAKRDSKYHKKGDTYTKKVNPSGKQGGTLRKGWTAKINHFGGVYVIEITNPENYASYVEYGHRQTPGRYVPALGKQLKKGWVRGRFMLTISEQEIRESAPKILEDRINKFLRSIFQ